jgi:rubrerythrin
MLVVMQGVQKLNCESCGTAFMSENGNTKCPSCVESASHGGSHGAGHSCGCGH